MPPVEASTDAPSPDPPRRHGGFRQLADALLTLAFAVILIRAFAVEGYMISTGSMGPTLPGFHKRVVCPACGYEFAVGAADDDHPAGALADDARQTAAETPVPPEMAVCPNCGKHAISLAEIPRNQGDQLLVFKNAFAFRPPRRWEVAVFRNPAKPTQAYVKRIVGLPGEHVAVKAGDVWIDNRRVRKNLAQQRAVRILVHDHNFEPENDPAWQPRWQPEKGWKRDRAGFACGDGGDAQPGKPAWVTYRHWVRGFGTHETTIDIPTDLKLDFTSPSLYPIEFNEAAWQLRHRGVLSDEARDRIARVFEDPRFKQLIHSLADESHFAPVDDDYGYNRTRNGHQPVAVRDLMLSCRVTFRGGIGRFAVELTDGRQRYRLTIDVGTRDILLAVDGSKAPVRRGKLKADVLTEPLRVELSLFDRQVLAAVNGHAVFEPLILPDLPQGVPGPRKPARFGATGLHARVDELQLFRDIYYTHKGTFQETILGDDEYFVLGDNSPISADSRVWTQPGVHRRLFLGKPFLVHLPSRPGRFRIGNYQMRVRIPDLSRIRYIR